MEVAGVVLGAVPILIAALKAWKVVHRSFEVFSHYSREVRFIRRGILTQQCLFDNELEALLTAAGIYREDARRMLANVLDAKWVEADTDERICIYLDKSSAFWQALVQGVAEELHQVQTDLEVFQPITSRRATHETLAETVSRLRLAVKITFRKSDYVRHIKSLRLDIGDLRHIRLSCIDSVKVDNQRNVSTVRSTAHLARIRRAAQALYEALSSSWSCANPQHIQHAGKLCLLTRSSKSVTLDLALSCAQQDTATTRASQPLWLYVRSLTTLERTPTPGSMPPPASVPSRQATSHVVANRHGATRHYSPISDPLDSKDLRSSKSLCDSLAQCHCEPHSEECLGYVEAAAAPLNHLRHLFYHQCTTSRRSVQAQECNLASLLERTRDTLTLDLQLFLAHSLAKALLQFHTTPWMTDEWRLKDLSFFQADGEKVEQALSTTHLTAKFQPSPGSAPSLKYPTTQSSLESSDRSDMQYLYGISNIPLFSLGVALLELGHRQPLEMYKKDRDKSIVLTARRLAQLASPLGQKYSTLTQRCLRCDFGHGSELDSEELQSAVYNDVVLPLTDILKGLKT